ncbi:hypothetical protein VTK73DRAFT_2784 [Phialemonium thermophilum]|uniref:Mitochondrial outer membrane transport complex Sam37/metaxin N-terminal domain-containing protein n=1 Tax=Phialemonium thermophilum TaxID=223376 RepID=A0ABR3X342_9PEZI
MAGQASPLWIDLPGEPPGSTESTANTFTVATATSKNAGGDPKDAIATEPLFGVTGFRRVVLDNGTVVPHWLYAWVQLKDANSHKTIVKALSVMACNETVEQVQTALSLFDPSLRVLESHSPGVDSSGAIPVDVRGLLFNSGDLYDQLLNLSTPHLLDPFFASLIHSRYAIPDTDLGSVAPGDIQHVVSAITKQHGIIRTQMLAALRHQTMDAADNANATSGVVSATLTSPSTKPPRRRVVQDPTATRALQILLAATALLGCVVAWAALPRTDILPSSSAAGGGSIAAAAALLADGSVLGMLGRVAEWQPTEYLRDAFVDGAQEPMAFRLGWWVPRRRGRRVVVKTTGWRTTRMQGRCLGLLR